ncbi:anthrone oxygenase family protein [Fulvivirga lutea]|uniref:DUF1772 domain-containing protein n=1 Tax=Fulvivirga lutea TaxID=2810512 RepID=A0A974WM64_9BACT|nr:DUF1772 domain-containing protein [Fulvivirga lutea]QSE98795.1 DUF1772 domain-containing protein [Fulvivirga lutea]
MEYSKTTIHIITILLLGLSGGFFYAWQVSVIPGTLKISDASYLETMKSINKEILNPYFFIIFFGALLLAITDAGIHLFNTWSMATFWVVLAAIFYAITFGITAFGNVPLNDALEALKLNDLNADELKNFRNYYEVLWNKYHLYRTWASVMAFIFIILGTINNK